MTSNSPVVMGPVMAIMDRSLTADRKMGLMRTLCFSDERNSSLCDRSSPKRLVLVGRMRVFNSSRGYTNAATLPLRSRV